MKLIHIKRTRKNRHAIVLVRVNEHEAGQLIQSLAEQLISGSPNVGRLETICEGGEDFSIAVHPETPKTVRCLDCGYPVPYGQSCPRCGLGDDDHPSADFARILPV